VLTGAAGEVELLQAVMPLSPTNALLMNTHDSLFMMWTPVGCRRRT
jgi:hypothetical protein